MPAIYTAPPVLAMTDLMEECFDVLDEEGHPTGEVLPRSAVHRLGRWHRAFHLFLVGRWDGIDWAVLQVRAPDKDVAGGRLDVAVGGHYRAGEHLADVLRETEEEIGLRVTPAELTPLWTQRAVHEEAGIRDREYQEVYLLRRDLAPERYQPSPLELVGLVAVPLTDLVALFVGERAQVEGLGLILEAGAWKTGRRSFGRADCVSGDEENLLRVARAALGWMNEEP